MHLSRLRVPLLGLAAFAALVLAAHPASAQTFTFTSGTYSADHLANDGTLGTAYDALTMSSVSGTVTLTAGTPVVKAINDVTFMAGYSSSGPYGPISYAGSETFTLGGVTKTLTFPYSATSKGPDTLQFSGGNTTIFDLGALGQVAVTPPVQVTVFRDRFRHRLLQRLVPAHASRRAGTLVGPHLRGRGDGPGRAGNRRAAQEDSQLPGVSTYLAGHAQPTAPPSPRGARPFAVCPLRPLSAPVRDVLGLLPALAITLVITDERSRPPMQTPPTTQTPPNQEPMPKELPKKEFLKAAALAAALGVGPSRVHQMIRRGELPHVRVGGQGVRVPTRAFAEYLDRLNADARASVTPTPHEAASITLAALAERLTPGPRAHHQGCHHRGRHEGLPYLPRPCGPAALNPLGPTRKETQDP